MIALRFVHSTAMELRPNVMRFAFLATFALIPAAALGACGSSNTGDVFSGAGQPGTTTGAGDASPDGESVDLDGSAPSTTDGAATDAAKPKDAGKRDGAVTVDADVADTNVVTPDQGIFCGTDTLSQRLYCDPSTQACCVRSVVTGLEFTCKNSGSACTGLRVPCSDTVDCGGQACCATYDNGSGGGYTKVECKATCGGTTGDLTEFRLCDPSAATDECAPSGSSCQASTAIDGWYVCKK